MKAVVGLIFLLSIVLSGCTTVSNIPKDYSLNEASGKGVLLTSISYQGRFAEYSVSYRKVGSTDWQTVSIGSSTAIPSGLLEWDIKQPGLRGDVFAIDLPSGEYEFTAWNVSSGQAYIQPTSDFSIRFNISPGYITYGGSFNFVKASNHGISVTGVNVEYNNHFDRDVDAIKNKYDFLDTSKFINKPEDIKPISKLGDGNDTHLAPIYIMH